MSRTISAKELKIGMYINLPSAWHAHPFFSNDFLITSDKQIRKILDYGIEHVNIDEKKGIPAAEAVKQELEEEPEKDFSGEMTIASEKLQETLEDKKMLTAQRASLIRSHSVDMIKNLWGSPTTEKIAEFKKGIFGIVDMIMADDPACDPLLRLTSYEYNTYIHSANVGVLATALAKAFLKKRDRHDMHALGAGFFLHDIGKINIDESIFQKKTSLTEEEMSLVRKHPGMGFRILNEAKHMGEESRLIIMQHHERVDGKGYPKRLRGNEIHIYAKICSVADVFDALVSKRPFKAQLKPFEALKIMKDEMLDHFEADVFEKFVLLFKT